MSYVVYNIETTRIVSPKPYGKTHYPTLAAAKAAKTRMLKMKKFEGQDLAVLDIDVYRTCVEKMVKKVNLMSGQEYWESVNTPNYCSPSSEAYWSM